MTIQTRETGPQFVEPISTAAAAQRIFTELGLFPNVDITQRKNLRDEILGFDSIVHMNATIFALALVYLNRSNGTISEYSLHDEIMNGYVQQVIKVQSAGADLSREELADRRRDTLTTTVKYARSIIEYRRNRDATSSTG